MRIVITGATGNVGSALVRRLAVDPAVDAVVGLARRRATVAVPKVEWVGADLLDDDLERRFAGADAVVHLAWAIQPARDRATTARVNVDGSRRVFAAAGAAGVGTLVHASSVGAYSPGPRTTPVDEQWPTNGIASSFYSRDKAAAEGLLDDFEREHPEVRTVRLRPGIVVQREAAAEIRRLFLGPFFPGGLLRPGLIPVLPDVQGVRFQVVHADDLAEAYALVLLDERARGPYNVAAAPVVDLRTIARLLRAVTVPVPNGVARAAAALTWRARLQPTPPGWLDLATQAPVLDSSRLRDELGWVPARDGAEALGELLAGLRHGRGLDTPPLAPGAGGPGRVKELLTGLGARVGL